MLDRLFVSLRAFAGAFAAATPGGSARDDDGVSAAIVPSMPDRSVVNCVVYSEVEALRARLGALAAAYESAGVRAWTVWVPPGDVAAAEALATAGNALDAEPMAMGRELDGIEPPPAGELDVVVGAAPGDVIGVLEDAYGWEGLDRALVRWADDYHAYLALADGRPAATLAIYDHDGDAHVTLVGTRAAARGRGLASLLMRRALADARERGCTTTTLVATRMGRPVYARLGYRDLGRVQMWERRRPA